LSSHLSTIADFIRFSYSRMNAEKVFFGHGTDNAWDESVALVLQTLNLPWDFARDLWGCALTEDERTTVLNNIEARISKRTPLAYLTKQAYFCGLKFYVDERTLVPRSPIAQLISNGFEPWLLNEPSRVMDLCTGSGCIGIATALVFEDAEVDLLDISPDALDVARINIEAFDLKDRVTAIESDCFSALDASFEHQYDLIVSNPPYVDAEDIASMPEEFRQEPMLGLASGADGLDFTRRMLAEARRFLSDQGILIAEVGNSWEALEAAFPDLEFTWLDFEHGGHGVFMLTADQLNAVES
jgi:ribosomal protein L3 glutamine methyltransferase